MADLYAYLGLTFICLFIILQMIMHIRLSTILKVVGKPPARTSFWAKISWLKNQSSLVEPSIQSKIAFLVKMRAALVAIVVIAFVVYVVGNMSG